VEFSSPTVLADRVKQALEKMGAQAPDARTLATLFETMYAASMHTEEGEAISFHLAFMDPSNPDPDPPPRPRRDRWKVWPFDESVPYDVEHLVKLAKASDPRTSSLAVYGRRGKLEVWGLVDQGNHYHDYLNFDKDSAQAWRPGVFQASIEAIAHVTAWIDYFKVAELRGSMLLGPALDALSGKRLRESLQPGAIMLQEQAKALLPSHFEGALDDVEDLCYRSLTEALRRILLRTRAYRHGGALLILPTAADDPPLSVKYPLAYARLAESMRLQLVNRAKHGITMDMIMEALDQDAETVDMGLYLDNVIAGDDLEDIDRELDAALWFIALLTRVDGLVVLDPQLAVKGFGAFVDVEAEPPQVFEAITAAGGRMRALEYKAYGSRHRSMMRACWAVRGSVGFVASQDGMIRGMTAINDGILVWPDLMLQRLRNAPTAKTQKQLEQIRTEAAASGTKGEEGDTGGSA